MDISSLQATLRQFAAERDWQPFHTPKNLSTALMVEAAELAEIFQWMTPEQSQAAHNDVVVKEQIADEVADVFLYLMQIADHTAVDLKRAVGKKLIKNAKKYPPLRPGLPAGTALASPVETHVLVDWENVQPRDADIRALVPDVTDVWLFHGPNQKRVAEHHASFGERATAVPIARTGKNALDFHLSFYMGYIASRHPDARFVVISNDKGYSPMLEHASELGFSTRQVGFSREKADVAKTTTKRVAAKKTAPAGRVAKKAASKEAAVTEVPAKKTPAARKAAQAAAPAKSVVGKRASARKTVPAKKAAQPAAAASADGASSRRRGRGRASAAPVVLDVGQATQHVIAGLKKTANKPAKQVRLMATIKSLMGPGVEEQMIHSVMSHLLASGKVLLDGKGGVRYEL